MMKRFLFILMACMPVGLVAMEQIYREQYAKVDATVALMQIFAGSKKFDADEFLRKRIDTLGTRIDKLTSKGNDMSPQDRAELGEAQKAFKSLTETQHHDVARLKSYQQKTAQITQKQKVASITVLVLNDINSIRKIVTEMASQPEFETILNGLKPYWENRVTINATFLKALEAADSKLGTLQTEARKASPYISGFIQLSRNLLNAYRLYIVQPIVDELRAKEQKPTAEAEKKISWWEKVKSYLPSARTTQLATGAALVVAYKGYSFFGEPKNIPFPHEEKKQLRNTPFRELGIANWMREYGIIEDKEKAHRISQRNIWQYENTLRTFRILLGVAAASASAYALYSWHKSYRSAANMPAEEKIPARYRTAMERALTPPEGERKPSTIPNPAFGTSDNPTKD